jgi:hypothetical protein
MNSHFYIETLETALLPSLAIYFPNGGYDDGNYNPNAVFDDVKIYNRSLAKSEVHLFLF